MTDHMDLFVHSSLLFPSDYKFIRLASCSNCCLVICYNQTDISFSLTERHTCSYSRKFVRINFILNKQTFKKKGQRPVGNE